MDEGAKRFVSKCITAICSRLQCRPVFANLWMTTVFLPNPGLTDDMQYVKTPDWNRLSLYYHLRAKFLNEALPEDFEAAANLPLPEAEA